LSITRKNHSVINKNNNNSVDYLHYLHQTFNKPFPSIKYQYTSTKEIEKIISSLKSKNSQGYNELSINLLKIGSPYISSPLCHICNKILSSGISPTRLKYAVIRPIFKKRDRCDMSNYRPIPLVPSFSKVFEKMYQHLINNILVDEEFGFRTDSSTNTATFNLMSEMIDALNKKKIVGGIFCDLKKHLTL